MLVKGINYNVKSIYKTAGLINEIHPAKTYLLIPTRLPAEIFVKIFELNSITAAYQILK